MKKFTLGLVAALWTSAALAEGPINAIPYGRGPGTGHSYAAAAANSILATSAGSVPGLTTTLPTAVQDNITRVGTLVAGDVPATLLSGTINCARLPALTGDLSTIAGACGTTLATVNANVGSFGSATQCVTFTVNAKGLITAASATTCTPAAASITGGQTLSRTDDTNVTLTLGGTPGTALLQSVSMTLGWTGTLATSRGGLGGATTPTSAKGLKGNGSAWITTTSDVAGSGACGGGQFVTAVNADAAPTCDTPAGGGDVTAASTFGTDNTLIRADGTGKGVQSSALCVADTTGRLDACSGTDGAPIKGASAAFSPAAGSVGEFLSTDVPIGSAVSCNTGTAVDVATVSLTAGNWMVYGNVVYSATIGTMTGANVWVSDGAAATEPTRPNAGGQSFVQGVSVAAGSDFILSAGPRRFSLGATTTLRLGFRNTGAATATCYGFIGAYRIP